MAPSLATLSQNRRTILAFGDSLTQVGREGETFVGYREMLIPALRKPGVAHEFVGPQKDDVSAHAGFGGANTKFLRNISSDVYGKYPADTRFLVLSICPRGCHHGSQILIS